MPPWNPSLPRLILASISPRRRELLAALRIPFEVVASETDESKILAPTPREFAVRAAREKCLDVARRLGDGSVVIGADTVVCFNPDEPLAPGQAASPPPMLGKPANAEEARGMLRVLSDRRHSVITAVAVHKPDGALLVESETSRVTFRRLSEEEIAAYVATGEPLDKAGAYGAQDKGRNLIHCVEGSLDNVIGLPLALVARMLEDVYPDLAGLKNAAS